MRLRAGMEVWCAMDVLPMGNPLAIEVTFVAARCLFLRRVRGMVDVIPLNLPEGTTHLGRARRDETFPREKECRDYVAFTIARMAHLFMR